jgi:hypothetical protein
MGRISFEHEALYDSSVDWEYSQSSPALTFSFTLFGLYSSADIRRVPLAKPASSRSSLIPVDGFDVDAEETGIWRGPVAACSVEVEMLVLL